MPSKPSKNVKGTIIHPDDRPIPALKACDVSFIRDGTQILSDVTMSIAASQQWALLGPNGAGKSSLLNIFAAVTFPSRGHVEILGHRIGQIDLRQLRQSIGFVNPRHPLRSNLRVEEIIMTGVTGTIEWIPHWQPSAADRDRVDAIMQSLGLADGPRWHTMSQGERGRALIGRALMTDPPLLLLDEPSTGLDVAAREQMIQTLSALPEAAGEITTVMVTHHFEELPPTITHAALISDGKITAAGPVDEVFTSHNVSACFSHPISITKNNGRWQAFA